VQNFHSERDVRGGQQTGSLSRPFDQTDIAPVEFVAKTRCFPLVRIAESIEIEVAQVQAAHFVTFKQSVGWALDPSGVTQRTQQPAHQRGLARAQIALQIDHQARLQHRRQTGGKVRRGGLIGQVNCELPPCGGMPAYPTSAMIRRMQTNAPHVDLVELAARIKVWGKALGFQSVGIGDTELGAAETQLLQWLADGHHGAMDYMAKHGAKRARPAELVPGTLRVISLRMNYYPENVRDVQAVLADGSRACISRYALGRDYHKVLRNRLQKLVEQIGAAVPQAACRVFTDSAPVLEVELAQKAHLGWRGKHTLLLSREQGSYFFLGEIFINLPLPVDAPAENHCGTCQACLDICPTRAIVAPYRVDARRCISYLTIELKGSIPPELRPLIGNRIYGCDDCQMVCPWNRFAQTTVEPDFAVRNELDDVSLVELFGWSEEVFFSRLAGSPIYRIGHEQWLRNIAVALGNAPTTPDVMRALHARANHPSELVREHVAWALERHA